MTLGTIALLAGLFGGPPCCDAALAGPAQAVDAAGVASLSSQDPAKPKSRERPAREPERRQADPPKAEPAREPRRDPPKAAPSSRGTQREPERPKSTGEPELRRRKP